MRWAKCCLAACGVVALSAFLAGEARAQRPGGFGFGGFQSDPISLLRNAAVRKELEIEADQQKQIEAVQKEMSDEMEKVRKEISVKYTEKAEKLLQPQQVERLNQISLQLRGVAALTDADVVKKIGLSDDQVKEIKDKQAEGQKKIAALRDDTSSDFQERMNKMREIRTETDKAVLGVLSESQQKTYTTMKGKEFDRQQLFQGGGFPGGGGGRKQRPKSNNT
jgi:hypothetical protein